MAEQEFHYQVVYPSGSREYLKKSVEALSLAGWDKKSLREVLAAMDEGLRRNPVAFGEPHFRVRAVDLLVCVGFARPFSVVFGVHESTRTVFVRKITLMTLD